MLNADNTAINNIYFYSLLSIDKMKENNQHNEIFNDWDTQDDVEFV